VAGSGTVDVVVACDGSPHSEAALRQVAEMLGDRIGRLTLVTVLDFDAAGGGRYWETENEAARRTLAEATQRSAAPVTETVLLNGRPAEALTAFATENGYHLLVAGARGKDRSKALLGSVAARLSRVTTVPVMLVAGTGENDLQRSSASVETGKPSTPTA
jgi:nucleotide-binding universal stress UspA family protein